MSTTLRSFEHFHLSLAPVDAAGALEVPFDVFVGVKQEGPHFRPNEQDIIAVE